MDCWGLGAGCCLALLLHSTLLGALIPQAYERERGAVGGKETEGGQEREGERWRRGRRKGCDEYCDYDVGTWGSRLCVCKVHLTKPLQALEQLTRHSAHRLLE